MDNTQQVSSNLGLNWSSSSLLKICCGPARQLWSAALAALQLWKATATSIWAQIGLNLLCVVYMPNRGEYNVQISKLFPYGFEKTFPQQIMWEYSIFIFSLSSTI